MYKLNDRESIGYVCGLLDKKGHIELPFKVLMSDEAARRWCEHKNSDARLMSHTDGKKFGYRLIVIDYNEPA